MKFTILIFVIISVALADDKATEEVIKGNNEFGSEVYEQLTKKENGNFLISPFSAETVLSLLQSGCNGQTAIELRKGLNLPNNKTEIEYGFRSLLPTLKRNNYYTFDTANKVYVSRNYPVKESFKRIAREDYYAECQDINFSRNVAAANEINKWVEDQTNNKIKNLVSPDYINGDTVTILVNALYFKANWSSQFLTSQTARSSFFLTGTNVVQIEMMHQNRKSFNYLYCDRLRTQFLELTFRGDDASMIFALPDEKNGLSRIEKNINVLTEIATTGNFRSTFLNVALPKFKIETTIDFNPILEQMGITRIFNSKQADLTGIGGRKGDLIVSFVVQKTYADVNEGGVEAAAATAIGVELTSVINENPKEFIADHPFIFWIKVKDVIIFTGRVTNPKY